jgi:hypothetical protein
MKTKFLVGISAVAVAAVALLFGGLLTGSKAGRPSEAAAPDVAARRLLAGFSP